MRLAIGILAALTLTTCGGDTFKDDLSFGTGVAGTGFDLIGQSDTFDLTLNSVIWFRFESSANFSGRFVRLYFNKLEQKDFAACANADAHICLSQFTVSNPGTYEVEGYLVKTNIDIGEETLVAKRTLTLK